MSQEDFVSKPDSHLFDHSYLGWRYYNSPATALDLSLQRFSRFCSLALDGSEGGYCPVGTRANASWKRPARVFSSWYYRNISLIRIRHGSGLSKVFRATSARETPE